MFVKNFFVVAFCFFIFTTHNVYGRNEERESLLFNAIRNATFIVRNAESGVKAAKDIVSDLCTIVDDQYGGVPSGDPICPPNRERDNSLFINKREAFCFFIFTTHNVYGRNEERESLLFNAIRNATFIVRNAESGVKAAKDIVSDLCTIVDDQYGGVPSGDPICTRNREGDNSLFINKREGNNDGRSSTH
ncbi:hypothetical protein L2E82_51162 [Cichorium intybus]|nr:hypothetical protein L2E82_51162 [Cichorium intybus]